jgi:hypothetical protein
MGCDVMSSMDDENIPIFGSHLKRMIWFKRIHEERDEIPCLGNMCKMIVG